MGTLFPDDDEYPDHRSVPTSWPTPKGTAIAATVGIVVSVNDQFPWSNPQEDPPQREFVEVRARGAMSAFGSISANPFFGNSMDAANQMVRRRWTATVDAVRAINTSPSFAGPPLVLRSHRADD